MTDAGYTILLHFNVDQSALTNRVKTQSVLHQLLMTYIDELRAVRSLDIGGGFLTLFIGAEQTFVTVRGFAEGIISINIEYSRNKNQEHIFSPSQEREMVKNIAKAIGSRKHELLPVIKRGLAHSYGTSSDERIVEYNIDKVIFKEKSPYQEVLIAHSASFGNMLFLDGVINHSSSDLIYTETLMQKGKEDYRNKEILILGGGDGSTLCELLKERPKFVVMVDIDEVVIKACQEHMRDVNNGVFDSLKGPNHEVIIGDCVEHLKTFIGERRRFDYVFGCLSDFPYQGSDSTTCQSSVLSLLMTVIRLSLKVLNPMGKYMCHCAGTGSPHVLKSFEAFLQKLDEPVEFSTDVVYVPSFSECWQFYQIWKKNE